MLARQKTLDPRVRVAVRAYQSCGWPSCAREGEVGATWAARYLTAGLDVFTDRDEGFPVCGDRAVLGSPRSVMESALIKATPRQATCQQEPSSAILDARTTHRDPGNSENGFSPRTIRQNCTKTLLFLVDSHLALKRDAPVKLTCTLGVSSRDAGQSWRYKLAQTSARRTAKPLPPSGFNTL